MKLNDTIVCINSKFFSDKPLFLCDNGEVLTDFE
jgi:hypothetical protein